MTLSVNSPTPSVADCQALVESLLFEKRALGSGNSLLHQASPGAVDSFVA